MTKEKNNRIEKLLQFLEQQPGDSFLLFGLAKEYEKLGDLNKAKENYLSIKDRDPEYSGTYYHLAKLYEMEGNYEKAITTYKEGIVICKSQKDMFSMAELTTALANLEMEID